jgi:hypothetical protein
MNTLRTWWCRITKPKTALSDRYRIRNLLLKEEAYASALAGFLVHGYNHGRSAKITITIDGTACEIGILASANEPLIEYLAQWACAEKLKKHIRLEEFDKVDNGKPIEPLEKRQDKRGGWREGRNTPYSDYG